MQPIGPGGQEQWLSFFGCHTVCVRGVGINSGMLEAVNDWGPECVQP